MRKASIIGLLLLGASIWICQAAQKHKPQISQAQENTEFTRLFATVFSQWDSNRDGVLDLKELNDAIEDPNIHGSEAAIAVLLHRRLQIDDEAKTNVLTLAEAMSLATDPAIQRNISGKAWHIVGIDHILFAPGDPNLETFHQGGIGDCYLLAVIGAYVFHHSEQVRTMIKQQDDDTYRIQFGNGREVTVSPVTDSELIMGASEGHNHGVWLSVLEKAYAQIALEAKERKTGENFSYDDGVPTDYIGHGGYYSPVIALLTGHKSSGVSFRRWLQQDPQNGLDRADAMLTKLSNGHKLMATMVSEQGILPKGLVHGHVYAVLGYDPATHRVTVFNPWGNHFRPAGPAGMIYGYPTDHGIFEVPLAEFIHVFGGTAYETDQPVPSPV